MELSEYLKSFEYTKHCTYINTSERQTLPNGNKSKRQQVFTLSIHNLLQCLKTFHNLQSLDLWRNEDSELFKPANNEWKYLKELMVVSQPLYHAGIAAAVIDSLQNFHEFEVISLKYTVDCLASTKANLMNGLHHCPNLQTLRPQRQQIWVKAG